MSVSGVPVEGPGRCTGGSTPTSTCAAPFWARMKQLQQIHIKTRSCVTHTHTWLEVSCRLHCGRTAGSHPADAASAAGGGPEPWARRASPAQGSAAPSWRAAPVQPEPAATGPSCTPEAHKLVNHWIISIWQCKITWLTIPNYLIFQTISRSLFIVCQRVRLIC